MPDFERPYFAFLETSETGGYQVKFKGQLPQNSEIAITDHWSLDKGLRKDLLASCEHFLRKAEFPCDKVKDDASIP